MNRQCQLSERQPEERLCGLMHRFSEPAAGPLEARLIRLKTRLLKPILAKVADSGLISQIISAANETATLAWYTGYPILLFPDLLEERLSKIVKSLNKRNCFAT